MGVLRAIQKKTTPLLAVRDVLCTLPVPRIRSNTLSADGAGTLAHARFFMCLRLVLCWMYPSYELRRTSWLLSPHGMQRMYLYK